MAFKNDPADIPYSISQELLHYYVKPWTLSAITTWATFENVPKKKKRNLKKLQSGDSF